MAIKKGTNKSETLVGSANNDVIVGLAGSDTLNGGVKDDFLDGGSDKDLLKGDTGNDNLLGGEADDTLNGGAGNDNLFGGDGDDTLNGDAGNDVLFGDAGDDALNGGVGNDTFDGGEGNDSINGGTGSDTVMFSNPRDQYDISTTVDAKKVAHIIVTYTGSSDNDEIDDGEDDILTNVESLQFSGGTVLKATDILKGVVNPNPPVITQKNTNPVAVNDSYQNLPAGKAFSQSTTNLLSNDKDRDGDVLTLTNVNNAKNGTVAFDSTTATVVFTPTNAKTTSGSFQYGIDDGNGGKANATVNLTFKIDSSNTTSASLTPDNRVYDFELPLTDDPNQMDGSALNEKILGLGGNDTINGKEGNDHLEGGTGDDKLYGKARDDYLLGNEGLDTIIGGTGNDAIDGGIGNDLIEGGEGGQYC